MCNQKETLAGSCDFVKMKIDRLSIGLFCILITVLTFWSSHCIEWKIFVSQRHLESFLWKREIIYHERQENVKNICALYRSITGRVQKWRWTTQLVSSQAWSLTFSQP